MTQREQLEAEIAYHRKKAEGYRKRAARQDAIADAKLKNVIRCQQCNGVAVLESEAEGYYCPSCGSSDSDE